MQLISGQYFGDVHQSINLNGLILTESKYNRKSSLPLHYHQNPYFCYVLSGNYSEHSFKKHLICEAGDIIFHPGNTEHHNDFNETSSTCFNLELSDQWLEKVFESNLKPNSIIKAKGTPVQNIIIKMYKEFKEPDTLSSLMIEGLMIEALVSFSRDSKQNDAHPYFIKKVKNYIDERYFSNPSLSELAGLSQVSREHLVREFKKSFNMTIGEYIRQIKVKHACNKLKFTNLDLREIVYETGFSDQSHFNKVFKKIIGVTPLEYKLAK